MKEQAIALLETIAIRKKKYSDINKRLRNLQGDFPTQIQAVDIGIESDTVALLDVILGDEIASYYLYESQDEEGGFIEKNYVMYHIKNLDDVRNYVFREGNNGN